MRHLLVESRLLVPLLCCLCCGHLLAAGASSALDEAPRSSHRLKELEDDFDIIDEFLENVLPEDEDLARNVEAARELREQWPRKKVLRRSEDYWPPEKAVEVFMSLPRALESCDYSSYLILVENYLAAFGPNNGLEPETKIQRIIQKCAQQHAEICGPTYLSRFHEEYSRLDNQVKATLNAFISDEVLAVVHRRNTGSYMDLENTAVKPLEHLDEAAKLIEENIKKHSKLVSNPESRSQEMLQLLVEPCRQFIEQLKDIFVPMKFDLGMDLAHYSEINSSQDKLFEAAWTRNKICTTFVSRYAE